MPNRLSVKATSIACLVLGGLLSPLPAQAGFEWVAPPPGVSSLPSGTSQEPPSTSSSFAPEPLTPSIAASQPPKSEVMTPPSVVTSEIPAAPVEMHGSEAAVRGFAKSVPLAVALRQVLPSGYSFSIDQNVDTGVLVSFQGGHPWRDTLRDTLAPVGLVMHERGQTVNIGYANAAPSPNVQAARPSVPSVVTYAPGIGPALALPAVRRPIVTTSLMPAAANQVTVMRRMTTAPSGQWTAERGESLHQVLDSWCHRSNIEFDWLAEYDYPLEASVSFSGSFEQAVRNLLAGFENAHPQPVAELHSNPSIGQMVLVVQTRGNTNSD